MPGWAVLRPIFRHSCENPQLTKKMKAVLQAIAWEVGYKNRLVFLALGALLGLGALLAWNVVRSALGPDWATLVERIVIMTFLISVLLAFAPFTMSESSGGWRMNSMLTRWFALPMPTTCMVFLPLLTACLFIAGLVAAWMPVLNRIAPGLDGPYFIAVLASGQIALSALAWTVPRKPMQFWIGAGILFPVILLLALGPQDSPNTEHFRKGALIPFGYIAVMLCAYTWFAAGRNRCGAWSGEVPFSKFRTIFRFARVSTNRRPYKSAALAMFRTECMPNLVLLTLSWFALVLAVYLWISFVLRESRPDYAFSWRVLPLLGLAMLPILGIVWMAVWSLFTAGDPTAVFRSRLSSFRATLPVSSGFMAGQKLLQLFVGWLVIWLPLALISFAYTAEITGIPTESRDYIQAGLARFMAVGAFLVVGALPLLLLGRFEGFGNFLLVAVCAWALCWAMTSQFRVEPGEQPGWRLNLLIAALSLKFIGALSGTCVGLRQGHTTWRFPVVLYACWILVASGILWGLPLIKFSGWYMALATILLLPLARLAWCPVALAKNRHR